MNPLHVSLSRREWLGRVSGPALVAAGATALGATRLAAQAASPAASAPPDDKLRGVRIYSVRDFGAKGDGAALDTAAVQTAIDACSRDGGGTVFVPAGDFVVGTLQLKDDVTLHLEAKGRLLGSKNRGDYLNSDVMTQRGLPPSNGNVVLLFAVNARNLSLTGSGTIDGQGAAYYTGIGDGTAPAAVRSQDPGANAPNRDRPHLLVFKNCTNVRMRDVFFTASAYHGVRILDCRQIHFDGVRIHNRVNLNNDGFHFNNCEYVHVSNCEIRCQDDACALFGSNKWVTITNCTFSTRWSIFRFGNGDTQNVTVSNCLIYETYGCPIKIGAGRTSRIENLSFSNIVMKNVTGPIGVGFSLTGGPGGRGGRATNAGAASAGAEQKQAPAEPPPRGFVRNLSFNNIRATVVPVPVQQADMPFPPKPFNGEQNSCLTLNGVGDAWIENVSLTDIHITYAGGGTAEQAAKRDIPQMQAEYFGIWNTPPFGPPAYGFFARNVRGLTVQNMRLEFQERDVRPAVIFQNVQDASIVNLSAEADEKAESVVRVIDSRDVLISAARVLTPTPVFLRLEGEKNDAITIDGGDLRKAAKPLEAAAGANAAAVKVRG